MADQFTSVSEQGLGGNLMDSIKGVLGGAVLFLLSFVVLWWNEGQVDPSEIAKRSIVVKPDAVDSAANGKLVSVTGTLTTDDKLGDPELLNPGTYIKLDRQVEMFAWIERKDTDTQKKLGGGKVTTTNWTYTTDWTASPKRPGDFKVPQDHENPALPLASQQFVATKASVAAYPFNPTEPRLPSGDALILTDEIVKGASKPAAPTDAAPSKAGDDATPAKPADAAKAADDKADDAKADDAKDEAKGDDADDEDDAKPKKKGHGKRKHHGRAKKHTVAPVTRAVVDTAERKADTIARRKPDGFVRANDTYLFKGAGSLERPQVGDVRVSFRVLKPGTTVTMFARLDGGQLVAYTQKDAELFRAEVGTRDQAIEKMHAEHQRAGWLIRFVGFAMMLIGLMLFFGPINALLDIIPFLGSAGRFLIFIAMVPVALVLSLITILLSLIAHNPLMLALFIVALIAGGYFFYQKKKRAG